jgi:hypothetical protein
MSIQHLQVFGRIPNMILSQRDLEVPRSPEPVTLEGRQVLRRIGMRAGINARSRLWLDRTFADGCGPSHSSDDHVFWSSQAAFPGRDGPLSTPPIPVRDPDVVGDDELLKRRSVGWIGREASRGVGGPGTSVNLHAAVIPGRVSLPGDGGVPVDRLVVVDTERLLIPGSSVGGTGRARRIALSSRRSSQRSDR